MQLERALEEHDERDRAEREHQPQDGAAGSEEFEHGSGTLGWGREPMRASLAEVPSRGKPGGVARGRGRA